MDEAEQLRRYRESVAFESAERQAQLATLLREARARRCTCGVQREPGPWHTPICPRHVRYT